MWGTMYIRISVVVTLPHERLDRPVHVDPTATDFSLHSAIAITPPQPVSMAAVDMTSK